MVQGCDLMLEIFLIAITTLASVSIVDRAASAGFLNGALTRGFAGASTSIVSTNFLYGYTNLDAFINACIDGVIGFPGYAFLFSIAMLAAVWISNLIEVGSAIR